MKKQYAVALSILVGSSTLTAMQAVQSYAVPIRNECVTAVIAW